MKTITLCADDYAQSPAVSAGIRQLIEAGRLTATGCMTQSPSWKEDGRALLPHAGRADIGLHFNLTHDFPGAPAQPLGTLLRASLLRTLDEGRVAASLKAQLDRFEDTMDMPPDFVDGHQHAHVFPVVRRVLLRELDARYRTRKPYLRAVNPHLRLRAGFPKQAFLRWLGAGFADKAKRAGFATNGGFAGIYSLRPADDFAANMDRWLAEASDGDLVMCHPGLAAADAADPIAATRPLELAFLGSAGFAGMLARHQAQLGRFTAPS